MKNPDMPVTGLHPLEDSFKFAQSSNPKATELILANRAEYG